MTSWFVLENNCNRWKNRWSNYLNGKENYNLVKLYYNIRSYEDFSHRTDFPLYTDLINYKSSSPFSCSVSSLFDCFVFFNQHFELTLRISPLFITFLLCFKVIHRNFLKDGLWRQNNFIRWHMNISHVNDFYSLLYRIFDNSSLIYIKTLGFKIRI